MCAGSTSREEEVLVIFAGMPGIDYNGLIG
jgi:hypothetical protein